MHKAVLVGLTILAISTSAASAWTHRTHHRSSVNSNASAAAMNPTQPMNSQAAMGAAPGVSSKDREMYMKNLHDSGYDQKNDRAATGNMKRE